MIAIMAFNRNKSPLLALLMVYVCFYTLGAMYLPRTLFLELLNGALAIMSLLVTIVYSIGMKRCQDGVILIRIGIALAWTVAWIQAFSRIYYFEFRPEVGGRTFDALVGLPAFVLIIGAALHLLALGVDQYGQAILRRNAALVAVCFASGFSIIACIKLLRVYCFF